MPARDPVVSLATHEVENQPPPVGDRDFFAEDADLRDALGREGAGWAHDRLAAFGPRVGSAETAALARAADRYPPELEAFDPQGRRLDEVSFHPAYHRLMALAIGAEVPHLAWRSARAGGHVAQMALVYLFAQAEAGVSCPMAMTYAAVPVLRQAPALAEAVLPRLLSTDYDPRCRPHWQKRGMTMGMFMTEKQGGSDVRTNSTRATPIDDAAGAHLLSGHKWFCSAPMSDAFFTLAQAPDGLSCFFLPRWRPDGQRNAIRLQRLKDKLGNRSNASAESELEGAYGLMVGPPGRGVRTIIDMVQHTRLFCIAGSAALMRRALIEALHHTRHRRAFQKTLIDQPAMRVVLADLALESAAALVLLLRVARAFDQAAGDPQAAALARIAPAIGKYWVCKRAPSQVYEAMECLGGAGYVETSVLPRLYREAPVNSIWEGSGNVMCLDVLRALSRSPDSGAALLAELEAARGQDGDYDAALDGLKHALADPQALEARARFVVERMAVLWQAALLIRHAPTPIADAFCTTRIGAAGGSCFGAWAGRIDPAPILARVRS